MKDNRSSHEENPIPESREGERDVPQEAEKVSERLERLEAALKLVVDHLEVTTKATRLLGAQQSNTMLASIIFAISATSILALSAFAVLLPGLSIALLRVSGGMSILLLGSALDLGSASLLRKAVDRAVLHPEGSQIDLEPGPWHQLLRRSYWVSLREKGPEIFHYRMMRTLSLGVYLVGAVSLVWALALLIL